MVVIVVLALLSIASPLFAQQYTMTDLGSWTAAQAVNAQSEIAGTCLLPTNDDGPCFWGSDGSKHQIGIFSECFRGYATALNDLGQVVGYCESLQDKAPAFIWTADQGRVRLATPDGSDAWVIRPAGINSSGVIVGWLRHSGGGVGSGFVYDGGTYTLFDSSSRAWGVNDNRQIVGQSGASQATMWDDAGAHTLPSFDPSDSTGAFGINGSGELIAGFDGFHAAAWTPYGIMDLGTMCPNPDGNGSAIARAVGGGLLVGWSSCPEYESTAQNHAFVYDVNGPGYGFDLNDLVTLPSGWTIEAAYGVNGAGQIVGTAISSDFARHGVVLMPTGSVTTQPQP